MKKYLLLLFIIINGLNANSQCYVQLRKKALQPPAIPAGYNVIDMDCQYNLYYVAYINGISGGYEVIYHYWKDGAWHTIPKATFAGSGIPQLLYWNGRIFASGSITSVNQINVANGKIIHFIEYRNNAWDTLVGGTFYDDGYKYRTAYSTNTGLYYFGRKDSIDPLKPAALYTYDTISHGFKKSLSFFSDLTYSNDDRITASKNHLLVFGTFFIDGRWQEGYVRMEGNSFNSKFTSANRLYGNYAIDGSNDHVYCYNGARGNQRPNLLEYDAHDSLVSISVISDIPSIGTMLVNNGQFLIGEHYYNQDFYSTVCKGDKYFQALHYQNNLLYNTKAYTCASGIYFLVQATGEVLELVHGAKLTGEVYVDLDANCQYDANKDSLVRNVTVTCLSKYDQLTTFTNSKGAYAVEIPLDTFEIRVGNGEASCSSYNLIADKENELYTTQIALKKPTVADVSVSTVNSNLVRWNSHSSVSVKLENNGSLTDSAWYEWRMDQRVKLDTFSHPSILSVKGNVIRGRYKYLSYFEKQKMLIGFYVDTSKIKVGDTLHHVFRCGLFSNESDTNNNHINYQQIVVYSRDPNHLSCDKDRIAQSPQSTLTYQVDFQNEGSADAIDVIVNNQLPAQLDIKSFKLIASSHPCAITKKDNLLSVEFKAINLQPKDSSEALSKGYFVYTIETQGKLVSADTIANKVSIVFDLNEAIVTNTVKVAFATDSFDSQISRVMSNSHAFVLSPNPSGKQLQITSQQPTDVVIYDLLGQVYFNDENIKNIFHVDVESWPNGLYIVNCGGRYQKFVKSY